MGRHLKAFSAVFPIILRVDEKGTEILLHLRQNTGYQDGKWDIAASGHVDEGETSISAVIRECGEELGIEVNASDVTFVHLSHYLSADRVYYDIYFVVNQYKGIPTIKEPEKCSQLSWFDLDRLPDGIIERRRIVIEEYRNKSFYSEIVENNF